MQLFTMKLVWLLLGIIAFSHARSNTAQRVLSTYIAPTEISPSVSVVLRSTLFDYVAKVAVNVVNEKFQGLDLADVDTVVNVKVVGDVNIILTNIKLVALNADPDLAVIRLGEGNVALDIENVFFSLEADYQYHQLPFPHVSGAGHLKVTGYEGVVAAIPVFTESNGGIQMNIIDAATDFARIEVVITGSGANWLYNMLVGMFRGNLKQAVCDKITAFIMETLPNEANQVFNGMPRAVDIFGAQLNTSFADNPSIQPEAAIMHLYGLFQSPDSEHFEECPYSAQSHTSLGETMTRGTVHVSVVNCFAWTLHKQGRMVFHLTPQNFSAELLNTSLWSTYIPGVEEMFPTWKPMLLDMDMTIAPMAAINPEEGVVMTVRNIKSRFSAIMDESDEVGLELFTLSIDILLGAIAAVIPSDPDAALLMLKAELTMGDIAVDVLQSNVGTLDPSKLSILFKVIFARVTDTITEYLDENPIVIPKIPLISLQNAQVSFATDMGILDADLVYIG
ncbi:hypothetical protein SmJEL517_g05108 [Synchytrium microbalum]|uniref:Lipid-binding serum glycoprotein C-terminal domain-containing protein n=1 Tax=Synchytrium microbalum TaxID=1806994 RepID=A0A507C285_9FUNG|nr:uncharacterized protein SmJEL517_g05108 [Synchytrium microbalum]TPX31613.1 hypothetical protein SmJEL517_g05108 [Synchytrium microbalum]